MGEQRDAREPQRGGERDPAGEADPDASESPRGEPTLHGEDDERRDAENAQQGDPHEYVLLGEPAVDGEGDRPGEQPEAADRRRER